MFNNQSDGNNLIGKFGTVMQSPPKTKITVMMVYKLLQNKNQSGGEQSHPERRDSVGQFNSIQVHPSSIFCQASVQEQTEKQGDIKTKFQYFQRTMSNNHRNNSQQIYHPRKYRIKQNKTIEKQCVPTFNRFVLDNMKKQVKKIREEKKNQECRRGNNFGLDIRQVKKFDYLWRKEKIKVKSGLKVQEDSGVSQEQDKEGREQSYMGQLKTLKFLTRGGGFISSSICPCRQRKKHSLASLTDQKKFLTSFNYKTNTSLQKSNKKIPANPIKPMTQKLKKYNDCMNILLNSFHCYLQRQQDKNKVIDLTDGQIDKLKNIQLGLVRYRYYIGRGNNCNLIRSMMRKRGWWVETSKLENAHFVWSQLKIHSVLERLSKINVDDKFKKIISFQQEGPINNPHSNLLKSTVKKLSINTQKILPNIINQQYLLYLFHQNQDKRYYIPLSSKQIPLKLNRIHPPSLFHNHYSNNSMLGNKNSLFLNITEYYSYKQKNINEIIPATYYLTWSNNNSFNQFQTIFTEPINRNAIWIVKPAQNSNRGQRISVTTTLSDIKSKLQLQKKIIVQSYIKNIMLYNGRKFDIRTYMLLLTINGRMKAYWYEQGYIRTASQPYSLTNLSDRYVHLTNDAVQKNCQHYGKYQQGNKLSYVQFQRYVDGKHAKECYRMEDLHERMRVLAAEAVKACYCKLEKVKRQFSFQLFGLDFIIDNNFNPLLIQINTNPCLELSSHSLQRLIPRMLENVFRLSLDPLFRPSPSNIKLQSHYIYDQSFFQRNMFRIIFDERFDSDQRWEQLSAQTKQTQTQQEEYQLEQKEVIEAA